MNSTLNQPFHEIDSFNPAISGNFFQNEISPNGLVTTYHYDEFNRLYQVKDQDQHVLKEFHYNYSK